MRTYLIRHGMTRGNLEGRYIGSRSDEALCQAGILAVKALSAPSVARVFVSPMRRCLETARLLFPDMAYETVEDFRECDFGAFEGENYASLNGRKDYQDWIDSGGEAAFPGGESRAEFAARCCRAYDEILGRGGQGDIAVVAHGGTVMAVMEKYARPRGGYFDFQVKCGEGYMMGTDGRYERL